MRKIVLLFIIPFIWLLCSCQIKKTKDWEPATNALFTRWSKNIDPDNPHPEYPRPMMVRKEWKNLNGLWDYSIIPIDQDVPDSWDGKILVPFPVESALSGVKRRISKDSLLWYSRTFKIPDSWKDSRIVLNFEAVDWETNVWINDMFVGSHQGGYDPFSFDITDFVNETEEQVIMVSVFDPTSDGTQPRGKQVNNPRGIWYTPSSGIWQTVWIEPVPEEAITEFYIYPKVDSSKIDITVYTNNHDTSSGFVVNVFYTSEEIVTGEGITGSTLSLSVPDAKLWTPDSPFLYDLEITLMDEGKAIDQVSSYFGMRKIALAKDEKGFTRMFLNNEFLFQNGPLDQGFWPDGLYTAPSDEALKYDIEVTKDLGFNMLRKHVKIESRRFYYWCDKIGILVWQDMPSGDKYIGRRDPDIVRTPESASQFEKELKQLIYTKFNHPSIIVWVPFNEGWGQYNTKEVVDLIKTHDPTRLVNSASGWTDRQAGDILDIHNYPDPRMPEPEENRAIVLGEFGGLGLPIPGHTWITENWGYENMVDKQELMNRYEEFYTRIYGFMNQGLSACVYTQITDVETETNGLLTYDREIIKMDTEETCKINTNNYIPLPDIHPKGGWINNNDSVVITHINDYSVRYTMDGSDPGPSSIEYSTPITLTENTILKLRAFSENMSSRVLEADFIITDIARPEYSHKYSDRYTAGGDYGLLDGERGTTNQRDGKWQGFEGVDVRIIFNLGQTRNLSEVIIGNLESTRSWIFPPRKITVSLSDDGLDWRTIGEVENEIPVSHREAEIRNLRVDFYATSAKFIQVELTSVKTCPEWHEGSGRKAWLFIDEIIIN